MSNKTVDVKLSFLLKMEIPEEATEEQIGRWLKHSSWNLKLPVGKILDMDNLIVEGMEEVPPDDAWVDDTEENHG